MGLLNGSVTPPEPPEPPPEVQRPVGGGRRKRRAPLPEVKRKTFSWRDFVPKPVVVKPPKPSETVETSANYAGASVLSDALLLEIVAKLSKERTQQSKVKIVYRRLEEDDEEDIELLLDLY